MQVIFDKLWDILQTRNLTRTQFRQIAGISEATLAKLGRDEVVSHATLTKICKALDCDIYDFMTYASKSSFPQAKVEER